ncbi:hypothetical protein [Pseudomonas paralcaligenes]|uniref:hypothetical protein n=1 Tax=Pseudomonas paralcaligenes TaxID=2772558 RepID=UPI001C7F760A|nr:hypothetical protein [Pseudomonas paralcaligenes]
MVAIEAKLSLGAWLPLVLLIMAFYLVILTATSWFYGLSVSMFDRSGPRLNQVALWLLVPLIVGFTAFIILLFFFSEYLNVSVSVFLVALATVLGMLVLLYFKSFRSLVEMSNRSKMQERFFLLFLALVLVCTVISGFFSTSLILKNYVGEDTDEAVKFVAIFSLATLVLSLAPAFAFFTFKGDIYRRSAFGCVITVVLFLAFLLAARGAMSKISYLAAGNLEIRQDFSARFVLNDHTSLEDFDSFLWRTRLTSFGKVEIEAFQLFSLGDVLLLCPSGLLAAKLHQLPRYTRQCHLTRNSKVDRKPLRLRYSVPTWQDHANRLLNWDGLRGYIDQAKDSLGESKAIFTDKALVAESR